MVGRASEISIYDHKGWIISSGLLDLPVVNLSIISWWLQGTISIDRMSVSLPSPALNANEPLENKKSKKERTPYHHHSLCCQTGKGFLRLALTHAILENE